MPFKKLRDQVIPALQVNAEVYEETTTGAMHYHLAADSKENVFLVAFPTIPDNSDGRAHILEHLALCGSARYPVRDPFFAMTRRSMATFMNAMTYAEKTVYPFASLDRSDFFNLLDVYLDAAFFPNLDYLDFRQEGWRYAYEGDKLVYQGVVFNEMKGAFTNPTRSLAQSLKAALFENTTYAVVSGGDPLDIPLLTHEDLKRFHEKHYHPAQAVFMSYGDIPAQEIQRCIDDKVLSKLTGKAERMRPQKAISFQEPKSITVQVPSQNANNDEYGFHFAWRLGDMTDIKQSYRNELLSTALIGDSASPLQMAMESAGYGRPAGYNGVDTSLCQMALYIGMEGLTVDQQPQARKLIWETLEQIAKDGIPHARLAAVLRDFEFQQQEISGGRNPFGLKRLLDGLPFEMNGGDPLEVWNNKATLEELRTDIEDPEFIKNMVSELVANKNRVEAAINPDKDFFAKRDAVEAAQLINAAEGMSDSEKQLIIRENAALLERQAMPLNTSCLPKIEISQIRQAPTPTIPYEKRDIAADVISYKFGIASNSVSYLSLNYNVSGIEEQLWQWLALYTDLLPNLGAGSMSFSDAEAWRHEKAPSFRVSLEAESTYHDAAPFKMSVTFSTKSMARDQVGMVELLENTINHARFDELERIQYLIESTFDDAKQSVTENGNAYANNILRRGYSQNGHFQYLVNGLPYLKFLAEVNNLCQTEAGLMEIQKRFELLHARVVGSPRRIVTAATPNDLDAAQGHAIELMQRLPTAQKAQAQTLAQFTPLKPTRTALYAKSQVNHCYQAWPAPAIDHEDAAALSVLAAFLENGYLHRALREEGGAYGASAAYNAGSRMFTMSSYRDPRLAATYRDFEKSIEWLLSNSHSQDGVDEAIISTLQSMDKPASPYGEALMAVKRDVLGMSEELRSKYRSGILKCTEDDLKRACRNWLLNNDASRSVFLGIEACVVEAKEANFEIVNLAKAVL